MDSIFHQRRYLIPFRAVLLPQIFTDVLVIGAGVAGMRAALAAADEGASESTDVIIATKGILQDSSTYWAQGGVAAVMDEADSFESHTEDTMIAGAGLCDKYAVETIVKQAPKRIQELIDWGMRFDQSSESNTPSLAREGGHTHRRILHADGDGTGKAFALTLYDQILEHDAIRLFDDCFVLDYITDKDNHTCLGAITHHPKYGLQVIWASSTIVASGGCGHLYRESTNPSTVTGDGIAAAFRAGAQLQDMAFVQFHPTTLYIAGAARSLISEAVRGEGAYLLDKDGHRFMQDYDSRGELAPRDVVAKSIIKQISKTQHTNVYLDVRHLGKNFLKRFPGISKQLQAFDINPLTDLIPVHPSAHYMVGGIKTDLNGRTNITGLYACGEVAATGLHGANRLASNSLLEGLVMGATAGQTALEMAHKNTIKPPVKIISDIRISERSNLDLDDVRSSLRSIMWRNVSIERSGQMLDEVQTSINFWAQYTLDKIFDDRHGWETQNMLTLGSLITQAARWRAESRGTHQRTDCNQTSDQFKVHDIWHIGSETPTFKPIN
ncbi:L-aspartate oxidase [Poriferisphaera corsica]|uniref:L-aspartate oxidase n=1 Tax=Poriferisphaera corsica TaxID=2528020 RepID=A0A517YTN2_9BACT|nr:L-aspartate oxidase [Poriferisphaera corsica]QDU33584.1 L-aspartate oxidase [Poriferisphaera corsica]